MKHQDDLADFFTEDENKEHEKWVKEEQRKDIGLKITNPNTDFPNTLGMFDLLKSRCNAILNVLEKLTIKQHPDFKKDIYLWFISKCYEYNINYAELKKAMENIFNIDTQLLDDVYLDFRNNHVTQSLEKLVNNHRFNNTGISTTRIHKLENEILHLLKLSSVAVNPTKETNKGIIELNLDDGKTYCINEKIDRTTGKPYVAKDELLTITPTNVMVYENIDNNTKPLFQWDFITRTGRTVSRPAEPLDQTATWLKVSGYYQTPWDLHALLSNCIDALMEESLRNGTGQYVVKNSLAVKGFHLEDHEIVVEDYELDEFSDDEIRKAINELHAYKMYFTDSEETFFATTFKWGLFAPFNVCYKQRNNYIFWLYLHGEGGVGKTYGYGGLIGHLWFDEFRNDFYIATDRYSTPARLGKVLGKSTFPLCLNETESVFEPEQNMSIRSLYKDAVECITLRETFGSGGSVDYAYSPCMCTSNGYIQDGSGAITRRSMLMCFSTKIRESKSRYIEDFKNNYHITFKDCKLNKLRAISHTFAHYLMDDVSLLDQNWMEVVDDFLTKLYEKVGYNKPEWLDLWVDNEDSVKTQAAENQERVTINLQKEINRERKPTMSDDPRSYVKEILKSNLLPGLSINRNDQVFITQTYIDDMASKGFLEHKQKLSQFAENYGWHHDTKKVFKINGRNYKGCWMYFDEFIEWIYGDALSPFNTTESGYNDEFI